MLIITSQLKYAYKLYTYIKKSLFEHFGTNNYTQRIVIV